MAGGGMPVSRMAALVERRTAERRRLALARARVVLDWLAGLGVEAAVVGSLARGTFRDHSDVDFLVLSCPPDLRYAVEGGVEDRMEDLPFDVLYLDELREPFRQRVLTEARRASDLS